MTDENNCEPAIDFTEIIQPVAPEISLISQQDILCYGQETGSIFIDIANDKPATDYNITWTGTNGYSSTQQNIDNLPAGTYNVNVIGEHCVKNAEFTLTQPEEIMLNSTLTPVSCYDGNDATATLNISGGLAPYTVVWEDDFSGFFRNNLSAGIQNIHITDFNNCEKTISLAIPEAPVFRIMPEVSPVTCYESNDAAINLNLIGGEEPVLLTWQDNGSSQTIRNNLAPGTYAVQITDGKGCQIDSVFTFAEPLPLTISETVSNNDCQNENSGSIEITVAGGTSPYQYLWSNNKTVQNLHNIPPGDYRVDVEDSNGCAISKEFTITKPLPVHLEFNAGQRFDCVTLLGSQIITAEATGGIPPYKKEWRIDNVKVSEEDSFIVSSNNQVVELKVTDRQGCFAQEVFQPEIPEYGIQTEMINCNEKNYRLSVVSTNLLGNKITDSYEWEFGDNQSKTGRSSEDYQYMESGKYEISVTVTDLDICPEPYTFKRNLVVNDPPAIHIDPRGRELQQDTFYFCEGETVILDAEGGMEYSWGTDSLLVSEEGNQTVIGYAQPDASIDKPSNKCQSVATVVGAFKDVTYKIKPPATNLLTSKNKEVEFSVEEILDDTKSAKWWVVGEEYNSSPGFDWIHEFSVEKDGEYTVCVEVENNDGCSDTNCVTLYVDKFFDELPNTFIADGENRFMKGWYIQILNRNHVLIYEGDEGWDGTFRNEGTPVSQDTYHYYIKDYEEFGVNRKYCYLTVFIKR